MTLQNKTGQPISQIHVTDQKQSVTNVQFDRPFHLVSSAARNIYSIYALDQPLAPGETITLTCNVGHQTRGFRDGNELAGVRLQRHVLRLRLCPLHRLQHQHGDRRSTPPS